MTKEELIAFGLNEAQAVRVMEKFAEDTKELVPKEKLEVAEQAKAALEKQVKEHDKNIEALKKSVGDTDKLNETISQLQEQGKKAAAEYAKNIKDMQVNFAVESALRQAKAKNLTAVKPFLNLDEVDIEDGKVKGLDKQIKKLIEGNDTKFLFDTPPKPNAGKPNSGIQGNNDKPNADNDAGNSTSINHGLSVGARMAQAYNKLMNPAASGDK